MEGVVEFITGDNRGRVLGQVFDLDASTGHQVPAGITYRSEELLAGTW